MFTFQENGSGILDKIASTDRLLSEIFVVHICTIIITLYNVLNNQLLINYFDIYKNIIINYTDIIDNRIIPKIDFQDGTLSKYTLCVCIYAIISSGFVTINFPFFSIESNCKSSE